MTRFTLISVGLLLAAPALPSTLLRASAQTTRYVAPGGSNDDGNSCDLSGSPCATISYAMGQSNPGDIIQIADGEYTEQLLIDKDITLDGESEAGTIIQAHAQPGQATGRVITIQDDVHIEISDATIRHGRLVSTDSDVTRGAGIALAFAELILTNVTISDNQNLSGHVRGSEHGGGMYVIDSNPVLTNVTFSGNTGDGFGGGLYVTGNSEPILSNVIFSGNAADYGGGVYATGFETAPPTLTLTNVLFRDNTAERGGGINLLQSNATLTNVTFIGNVASGFYGGGMHNQDSSPELVNVIFWNNQSPLFDSIGNDGVSHPTITYSLVAGSGGSGNWNPDIGIDGGGNIDTDPLFIDPGNGDFTPGLASPVLNAGDPATDPGIFPGGPGDPVDLAGNPRFQNVGIDMGALESPFSSITPGAGGVVYVNTNVDTEAPGYTGAGDSWSNARPELHDVLSWAATGWAGALQVWVAQGTYLPTGDPGNRSATFRLLNDVAVYGGFDGTETDLSQRDWVNHVTTLSGDIDSDGFPDGNAFHVVTGSGTDPTARLDGFHVIRGNADGGGVDSFGGGMINEGGSPMLVNVRFQLNDAAARGGGVYNTASASPTFENVVISANEALGTAPGDGGGGMYNDGSSPTITGTSFSGNESAHHGGGVYNANGSTPVLTDVGFATNTASVSGGGMYNNSSSPILDDVGFSGNEASGVGLGHGGGGMYNTSSSPTLTDVIFSGNEASRGGGMLNRAKSSPELTNVIITENTSIGSGGGETEYGGGGMYNIDNSSPVLTNVAFTDNSAGTSGGGMLNNGGAPTLANVTFSGNAATFGGGMFNGSSSPTLVNVLFDGNTSAAGGGGVHNFPGSLLALTNVTFTDNSAGTSGGAMLNNGSSSTLRNVVIWNNEANSQTDTPSASIFNQASTTSVSNSLIANSGGSDNWNPDIGTDGGGNVDVDPFFVDPENGDFTPGEGSPAIDAGDPATDPSIFPTDENNDPIDLAGNPRIRNGVVDMGALESPFSEISPTNNILYVDQGVVGGARNGSGWANALPELRRALEWAAEEWDGSGDSLQVWVAAGTYLPTPVQTDRTASFHLVNNVAVYGGFAGDETELGQRDWENHVTTLSGHIDSDGTPENNSYHVVTGSGTGSSAVLDGFTVTGGNADNPGGDNAGAGVLNEEGSPTLANLIVSGNAAGAAGGGMANFSGSSPTLTNVVFSGNEASQGGGMVNAGSSSPMLAIVVFSANAAASQGGGMYNVDSSPVLTGVTFSENTSVHAGGGLYSVLDSSPTLTNVTFSGNSAGTSGGGMLNDGGTSSLANVVFSGNSAVNGGGLLTANATATLTNVTFAGNTAEENGGGFYAFTESASTLRNVIVWGNAAGGQGNEIYHVAGSTVTFSYGVHGNAEGDVAGGGSFTAENSLTEDPLFEDAGNGDLHLTESSPAIDAGDHDTPLDIFPGGPDAPVDLAGDPRVQNGRIDVGAYESQIGVISPTDGVLYVNRNVAGGNRSGASWTNAQTELATALRWAATQWSGGDDTLQVWVAQGTYLPLYAADDLSGPNPSNRDNAFVLVPNVQIFGGFEGDETTLEERDWAAHETVLSGNLGNPDTAGDNAHHVLISVNDAGAALVDGVTVTGGNADGKSTIFVGGVPISQSQGGGVINVGGAPVLRNVRIAGNHAQFGGGLRNNAGGAPVLTNVVVLGNTAETSGGGMFNDAGSPVLTNVTLNDNEAQLGGGLFNAGNSNPALTNSVVWGNTAAAGANQIYTGPGSSTTLHYSLYGNGPNDTGGDGTLTAENSLTETPLFVDEANGDLHLLNESPAVDAGDPETDLGLFPVDGNGDPLDLAGGRRVQNDGVDIGAFEFQAPHLAPAAAGGWRLLTVPGGGLTVDSLAALNLVQGVPDGAYPGAAPNLYVDFVGPDNVTGYVAAESVEDALAPGRGFFWYLFEEAEFSVADPPDEWTAPEDFLLPAAFGTSMENDVTVAFEAIPDTTGSGLLPAYMIGNPFRASFQLAGVEAAPGTLHTNFYAWDPEAASYVALEPADRVSLWQGVWAEVDGSTEAPTFTFAAASADTTQNPPIVGIRSEGSFALDLTLRGTLEGGQPVNDLANKLRFEPDALLDWDRHDGSKFMPPFGGSGYVLLSPGGVRKGSPVRQSVRSLPGELDEQVTVPVAFLATESGEFTISASAEDVPEGWAITLHDLATDEMTDLLEESYMFTGEAGEDWQERFTIEVVPAGVGATEDVPAEFHLSNVYPNPATTSTALVLRVPEAESVTARLYDALGRLITTVHDGTLAAGEEVRLEIDAATLAAGAYVVRIEGETFAETRRFAVVR